MLNFLTDELADLEQRSLKRSLRVVTRTEGARITIGGRTFLNFSSNNYLGLARHPRVIEAARQALASWGAGATSSRLISGTTALHEELESELASFLGMPAALLFPTGYMANIGVVTSLVGPGDAIILDRLCHASLMDAARLSGARLFVYRHVDAADAEKVLRRTASYRRRLLATESLFSMDGDFAPLEELSEWGRRYEAIRLVDEAHAIGVWGEVGRGLSARGVIASEAKQSRCSDGEARLLRQHRVPRNDGWDVVVGTLSKSLGSQGGFVAGSRELVETLLNKARSFIYTTGLSPVCLAAAREALRILRTDDSLRRHLQEQSARLRMGLRSQGWNLLNSESQIVPVLLGSADRALACADHLQKEGVYAPAIRPPTVSAGECRIRFSVTSEHSEQDIETLLTAMSTEREKQ